MQGKHKDLTDFAQKKKLNYETVQDHAGPGKWREKRAEYRRKILQQSTERAAEKTVEKISDLLSDQAAKDAKEEIEMNASLRSKWKSLLLEIETIADLRSAALTLEASQRVSRSALSVSSEDSDEDLSDADFA